MSPPSRAALVGGVAILASALMGGVSAQSTGIPCTAASNCKTGQFCRFTDNTCRGSGQCWNPPELCTADFNPVCGCDGVTYSNRCMANAHSQSVRSNGSCRGRSLADQPPLGGGGGGGTRGGSTKKCGGPTKLACPGENQYCKFTEGTCGEGAELGECHSQPVICSMIYRPVCGCNGKEYANECEAANAGVSVRNYGSCGPEKRE